MKSLIISIVSLGLFVSGWCVFVNFTDKNLHQLMGKIEDDIIVSVYQGEWDQSLESFKEVSDAWHKQKKVYSFFLDTSAINETDYSFARADEYIKAKNLPLTVGELSCIKEQLGFLHLNEQITLENIF